MKIRKKAYVGGSLEAAARRLVEAWHRTERGEKVAPRDNVTFITWAALAAAMTDKRHALLRHLHARPAPSMRALARALKRDYKRVHEDVRTLTTVGLVERKRGLRRADYDEIRATIRVEGAAA